MIDMVYSNEFGASGSSEWDTRVERLDAHAQYDLLYAFLKAAAPGQEEPAESYFGAEDREAVYAVLVEGEIAAHAAIWKRYEGAREVADIYTHPAHRGRGIASAVVRHCAKEITSAGLVATCVALSERCPLRQVGKKAGFVEVRNWYHGSPLMLSTLREGSTITPFESLAEAFSHKPTMLSINDDGSIWHNGTQPGYLHILDEPIEMGKDIVPHPRSTMGAEKEWLTTRDLPLRLVKTIPPDAAQ